MTGRSTPHEIALSAAWHAGIIGPDLLTVDGQTLQVIHRGAWSHGLGPDFRDALILFNGHELRSGSVEIHLSSRGWNDHGHHLDPAYENVVLHVVGKHDGALARRLDGALVPIVQLGDFAQFPIPEFAGWDWDRVGGQICAVRLASTNVKALRDILLHLGDVRLASRSARIESRLSIEPPGQVLWEELLDGLGFAANREPMGALARTLPIDSLELRIGATPAMHQIPTARGILLGVSGFLPLSPAESHLARLSSRDVSELEAAWRLRGAAWGTAGISPSSWNRARVRPANHPTARLVAAADIIVSANRKGGLLAAVLEIVIQDHDPIEAFRRLATSERDPPIGADRALDILASGIIPFAVGFAAYSGNSDLLDAATGLWERLPGPSANAVTRRAARQVAGSTPLGKIGARGSQGLIHLDTVLCQPRRCFECPIAAAELVVKG